MNILDALQRGLRGERIKREGGEWLLVCSDMTTLRFVANRQIFHPSITDILATNWMAENDFVSVSNRQVEAALRQLGVPDEEQKQVLKKLGFA
jgi:hypothetical protein